MAISDIVGGPADVKLAGGTIGNTTGGVTATITPQNRERIVDKYGSTALAIIHTGDECRVTVPWSEWGAATLNEVYDPGTDAGSFKGIGRSAGYIYTTQAMIITPYLTADVGDTVEFFAVTPIGEVSMAFNNDDDRILEVEYAAVADTTQDDGKLLGQLNVA